MTRPKKVSQTQLARELGISQALVSLVLNGRRQGISPETYERIWAHAVKRGTPSGKKTTSKSGPAPHLLKRDRWRSAKSLTVFGGTPMISIRQKSGLVS